MNTVLLAYYNDDKYIDIQIESILQQTRLVDKIVIVNDFSKDHFKEYIQKFESSKVVLLDNECTKGTRAAIFDTICSLDASVIFLADQDDVWFETKIERIISYFDNNPGIDLVCSNATLIGGDGWTNKKTVWDIQGFSEKQFSGKNEVFQFLMLFGNFTPGATMALRKSALSYLLPYDTATNYWHDEWFIFLAAAKGKLGLIDEPLIKYRLHDNQQVGLGSKDDFEARIKHVNHVLAKDINAENANGLLGIYWNAYQRALFFEKKSKSALRFSDDILKTVYELKFDYLKQLRFLNRYYLLLRWWYSGLYKPRLKDIFLV